MVSFRGHALYKSHHNLETLKQALVEAVDNFPMDVIRRAIDERAKRFWRCIKANGAIMNNFFFVVCSSLYQ